MPFNGSGIFNRVYSWVADKAAGLDISSSRMDTDSNDIASNGLGNCLTRDGQGQATANLPMAGFRHTGVSNAVNRTDYAAFGQVQDGLTGWTIAGGSADAITATYTPTVAALTDGMLRAFRATAANATTTPTFAPDSLTAHTITRMGGAAAVAGDIPGGLAECWVRYNLANTRWELLNPAQPQAGATLSSPTISGTATFSGSGAINIVDGSTGQRPGSPVAGALRFNNSTGVFEGYTGVSWVNLNSPGSTPTITTYTSGTGNYSTPAGAVFLVVEMVGGGGGGGGSGAAGANGTTGNQSSFNSVIAAGGAAGGASTTTSGQAGGGGGTGGTGGATARFPGAAGNPGGNVTSSVPTFGGSGGQSIFGGRGTAGTSSINAGAAQSNTGSGGGGAGSASASFGGAGGGGSGEYARIVITGPTGNYAYAVGASANGGTGTTVGGAGAAGVIIVTAYYQ
jgi:hypothetical protein